jgi:ATP-binding cassette subfamily G (WHITE) protein 2
MNILNPEYYINNNDENNNIIVDQSNEQNNTNSNIIKPRLTIKEKDDSILDGYKTSGMEDNVNKKCNEINSNVGQFSKKMKKFIPSFGVQFKFLIKRHLKNIIRDKRIIKLKMAQTFGLGLIIGLTFYDIPGSKDDAQFQDRQGGLFIASFSQVLLPMIGTLSIFSSETPVVIREISSGYYTAFGYYFSKITFEIPFQLFITSIACSIIYFLSNYQCTFMKFLKFLGTIELGALCGLSLGLTIATIAKNIAIALQFAPFLVITMIIYSGLLINVDSIPVYFTWLQYVFPVRYMYQEVVKNEFYDLDVNDSEDAVLDMSFDNLSSVLSILILDSSSLYNFI